MKRSAISFRDPAKDVVEFEPIDGDGVMVTTPVNPNVVLRGPQLRALLDWLETFLEQSSASDDPEYIRRYEIEI